MRPDGFWQTQSIKWSQRLIAPHADSGEVVERAAKGWTKALFLPDDDDYDEDYDDDDEIRYVDVIATDRSLWIHPSEGGNDTDIEKLPYVEVVHVSLEVRRKHSLGGYDVGILAVVASDGREWSLGFEGNLGIGLAESVVSHVTAVRKGGADQ